MKKNFFVLSMIVLAACMAFVSCDDDTAESSLPELGNVVVSPSEVAPGETVDVTVNFSKKGSYVKGTYRFSIEDVVSTSVEIGSSYTSYTLTMAIPETAEKGVHNVVVSPPSTMSAFAGSAPYLDSSKMKAVSTTLTIK